MTASVGRATFAGICVLGAMAAAAQESNTVGTLTVTNSALVHSNLTVGGSVALGAGAAAGARAFAWSGGQTVTAAPNQFVVFATNGIFLDGAPVVGNGSGLTNLSGAGIAAGSIGGAQLATGAIGSSQLAAQGIANTHIASSAAIAGSKLADGSVGTNKATLAEWNAWGNARYMSLGGGTDLTLNPGRIAAGSGLSLASIASTAQGASLLGSRSTGTQGIGWGSHGATQRGWNHQGAQSIGSCSYGASQVGQNSGSQSIGNYSLGARQEGFNRGLECIGGYGFGTVQQGFLDFNAAATNNGMGSIQLLCLSSYQQALMNGHASLGLGACTVTHNQAIVAGDGQTSHGNGTVTAVGFHGAFHGSGTGLYFTAQGDIAMGAYTNGLPQ